MSRVKIMVSAEDLRIILQAFNDPDYTKLADLADFRNAPGSPVYNLTNEVNAYAELAAAEKPVNQPRH